MSDKREISEVNLASGNPTIPEGSKRDELKKDEISFKSGVSRLHYRVAKIVFFQFYRIHFILFILSFGILSLSLLLHVNVPIMQEIAAGFLIFWMPGFCVMFLLWDSSAFKPIYLLPLTLAFSQVVVISMGLVCAILGILWTPLSVLLTSSGFIIGSYCIAWKFKRFRLVQPLQLRKCDSFERFYERFKEGKIIPKNFGYLFIFMLALGFYAIFLFPVIQGDDPWFHARILRFTLETGIIQFDMFRGAAGLHIYASSFGLLLGWDALTIARWFPIFLVINGDLAFYLIVRRLFKNPQIANLGTFFVSFTPLMYYWGVNNFWSNAIAQPFGMYLMFFLFDALLRKKPTTRAQKWTYIVLGLYLSFILRIMHGEVFITYWLSAVFVIIFFLKKVKSLIIYVTMLLIVLGLFVLVESFYPSYLTLDPSILFAIPPLLWLLIIPGCILGILILKKYTTFPPGNYEIFATGTSQDGKSFYHFEKKFLKFIIGFGLVISIIVVNIILDYLPIILRLATSLLGFAIIIELIIAFMGNFVTRRHADRGKIVFFWSLFFIIGAAGYFAYDVLFTHTNLSNRMLLFASPGIILLTIGYVAYALQTKNLNQKKVRLFLACFAVSSLVACTINYPFIYPYSKTYEITAASDLGQDMFGDSILITGFKWWNPIQYFAYKNVIYLDDVHLNYLFPEDSGLNRTFFYSYRNDLPDRQIYVILDSTFLTTPIHPIVGADFGTMTMSQIQQYENISYFNHVYSYGTVTGDWGMIFCLV